MSPPPLQIVPRDNSPSTAYYPLIAENNCTTHHRLSCIINFQSYQNYGAL